MDTDLWIALADIGRTVAVVLIGMTAMQAVAIIRIYRVVDRHLTPEARALRLVSHALKGSVAYLGLAASLFLWHLANWGGPPTPVLIDIPFLILGFSAMRDVYKLQKRRLRLVSRTRTST